MSRCPITYESCEGLYSGKGLKLLSRYLTGLHKLSYTALELRQEAAARSDKMSIQGVQPKLSAKLNIKQQRFDIVNRSGRYILKPQTVDYPEVPENEDLTMRMAHIAGIEVPMHGLLYGKDGQLTYCIRRFDRVGRSDKVHVEDFAQLGGKSRETKYRSSMEQVAGLVDNYCTFPVVEKLKLFRLTLFSFLVGNEDMHLKNFSVLHQGDIFTLSPAYDLVNTTVVLNNPREEFALPVNGKKQNLTKRDLVEYFGRERLGLATRVVDRVVMELEQARDPWQELLARSFMSAEMKEKYFQVLEERFARLYP